MQVNFAVFVNRDRLSGFGTPWEVLFQSNYTVLIKGGNVGGYTALFSFIPELKLGKWIVTEINNSEFQVYVFPLPCMACMYRAFSL